MNFEETQHRTECEWLYMLHLSSLYSLINLLLCKCATAFLRWLLLGVFTCLRLYLIIYVNFTVMSNEITFNTTMILASPQLCYGELPVYLFRSHVGAVPPTPPRTHPPGPGPFDWSHTGHQRCI